jgi:hypothetical protein
LRLDDLIENIRRRARVKEYTCKSFLAMSTSLSDCQVLPRERIVSTSLQVTTERSFEAVLLSEADDKEEEKRWSSG